MSERLERIKQERPRLYASRHVAKVVGEILLGMIGVGAFFKFVALPSIDIDPPDTPSLPLPDLPELPGWVGAIAGPGKYVVLLIIAILVAVDEVEKRKRKS